uniref:Uncharacterized protein n=1 Tax=Petromyzon marinus TaxID=7757 RepID=S4RNP3_PETMA
IRGPPPKIVPISGRLEKSVEKKLIRPIALKPAATTLSGGGGGGGSSRGGGGGGGGSSTQRPSQTSGPRPLKGIFPLEQNVGQHVAAAGQCLLSDSGRNSLSSLPTSVGAGVAGAIGRVDGLCVVGGPGGVRSPRSHRGVPLPPPRSQDSGRGSSSSSSGGKGGGRRPTGTGGSEAGGSCDQSPCSDDPYDVEEEFAIEAVMKNKLFREAQNSGHRTCSASSSAPKCCSFSCKAKRWVRNNGSPCNAYGARLRQAGQKAQRAQHMAQLQVFQLTQEKRRLQEEDEVARLQGNCQTLEKHCSAFQRQQNELAPRLEETKWEV